MPRAGRAVRQSDPARRRWTGHGSRRGRRRAVRGAARGVRRAAQGAAGRRPADGDRALAADIGALPKPSVAAWVCNLLVRAHREEIEGLVELGETAPRGPAESRRRAVARAEHAALAAGRGTQPAGGVPRPGAGPPGRQRRLRPGRGHPPRGAGRSGGRRGAAHRPAHRADVLQRRSRHDRRPDLRLVRSPATGARAGPRTRDPAPDVGRRAARGTGAGQEEAQRAAEERRRRALEEARQAADEAIRVADEAREAAAEERRRVDELDQRRAELQARVATLSDELAEAERAAAEARRPG